MHSALVLAIGFAVLGASAVLGRLVAGVPGTATAALLFLPLWFLRAALNMYLGVKRAGYSVADEAPIFLLVFTIPAATAIIVWWSLR